MNFQFSIFKHGARGLIFALIFTGLVLSLPGTGQGQSGNLTIILKGVSVYSKPYDLSWEFYNKPFAKETIPMNTVGTLWSGLSQDTPPRKTIRDIILVGSAADGLMTSALNVLIIDIDPSKTGKEIIFKVIGLRDTELKAENQDFDISPISDVTFSFKIVFGGAGGAGGIFENPLQAKTFQELVERLINFAFVISLVLAPLMVLIAGLVWLTAGGRPDAITRGRNILYWTLIGFTIVLLARGLIAVLKSILGG